MADKILKLYWSGNIVGEIFNPSVDNFDFYGKWKPTGDRALYRKFLEKVDANVGVFVQIGEPDSDLKGETSEGVRLCFLLFVLRAARSKA